MAYTGSVGIMPGAATEKLPFVHSNFKPRSKFAKCFAGFKKYTGGSNSRHSDYKTQKLPQVRYSGFDERSSLGSGDFTERKGYSGFTGSKKITKKKGNNETTSENPKPGSKNVHSRMKSYFSLPNLNTVHKSRGNLVCAPHVIDSDKNQRHQWEEYDEEKQRHDGQRHNNLDSLIFFDEDSDLQHTDGNHHQHIHHHHHHHHYQQQQHHHNGGMTEAEYDSFFRSSPHGNHTTSPQMDTLAKGVFEKLRDARGKSGMKRSKRREPDHARVLGDLMTSQRLRELLMPRKDEGPLMFA